MAQKIKLSLIPAAMLALSSISVWAQEDNFTTQEIQELKQPQHSELQNIEDDKPLLMDFDARSSKGNVPSSSNKDAANTKKNDSSKANKEKAEEDPLNFNFLYFIIQRFKISDIVDD